MTNVSLGEGLKYLAPLGQNIYIEELCITFNKLISVELDKAREKRFGKKSQDESLFLFPKGENTKLKKLTLYFPSSANVGNVHGNDELIK